MSITPYVMKYASRAVESLAFNQGFCMGSDSDSMVDRGRARAVRFGNMLLLGEVARRWKIVRRGGEAKGSRRPTVALRLREWLRSAKLVCTELTALIL